MVQEYNIPIWPGSSSFTTGSTPFGHFDTDATFTNHADKVATWCATRLGYPLAEVELQDTHFYACFEEAVVEYSNQVNQFSTRDNMLLLQGSPTGSSMTGKPINPTLSRVLSISKNYGTEAGSGGYVTYRSASIDIKVGQQVYDLSNLNFETPVSDISTLEIKRVYHTTPPAITRYFDPTVGAGLGSQAMLDSFGWGNYSPGSTFLMMPMYADLLRLQSIEFNDLIRKSAYTFEITGTRLKIFPIPRNDYKVYIDYITTTDRNASNFSAGSNVIGDFSNTPYDLHTYSQINSSGKQWILKYTLALAKEVLGNIRSKYGSIPIPNGDVTLNGSDLISQAQSEKDQLIDQLRENLDAVSRQSQLQRLSEESDSMQQQLLKIPLPIYIG